MTRDDFIYAFMLIISIFSAFLSNKIQQSFKKYFMSFFGLVLAICVCGSAIWHSLVVTLVSVTLICLQVKRFHILVFVTCFAYLVFFRTCHLIGLSRPPSCSNALQLVLTLKLVGAAFEIKDSLYREKKLKIILDSGSGDEDDIKKLKLEIKYFNVKADVINLLTYSYCFIGLLTGPYFKYRVYLDCIQFSSTAYLNRFKDFWIRLKYAVVIGLAYLVTSHFYYIEYANSDEFYDRNFLYRFAFMSIMFLVFRMRMYFAWLVSECVCMCAGMGAYPARSDPVPGHGPTNLEEMEHTKGDAQVSYETTRNLSLSGCEWAPTVREGMRSWNMTVQYWLASFVYRRFPVRAYRTLATMLVSAFWHGVHPGYYLSFLTIPLSLHAESALESILAAPRLPGNTKLDDWKPQMLLDKSLLLRWFYKMRVFDYCCMGFLLLEASSTLRYWWSIWFSVHLSMILMISISTVLASRSHRSSPSGHTATTTTT